MDFKILYRLILRKSRLIFLIFHRSKSILIKKDHLTIYKIYRNKYSKSIQFKLNL